MIRRSPTHRLAAALALLLQLVLQSGLAWRDARAEGESFRRDVHVESLGVRHAEPAHAADCAVSQHLQAHSAPAARVASVTLAMLASVPLPPRPDVGPLPTAAGGTSSRGPPSPV
jgi:hypothetical protein